MRKLKLFATAIAIVTFASCSSDEVVSNVQTAQVAQQSIGFSPLTKGATRGVVTSAADLGNFAVTAYVNTAQALPTGETGYYFGSNSSETWNSPTTGSIYSYGTTPKQMKNTVIAYNAGGWDYANGADMMYWPYVKKADGSYESTSTLDFVAISPASIATATTPTYAPSASGPGATITNYTISTDDVCYASTTGKKQSDGAVPLNFKHLLSQVVFAAKQASGFTAEIKEIKLGMVPNQGSWSSATSTWTATGGGTTANYAGVSAPVTVTASGDAATAQILTASGSEILLMPQNAATLTYDPTTIGTGDPDDATNPLQCVEDRGTGNHWSEHANKVASGKLFLMVSVRIKAADGSYTLGDATTYEDIYYCVKTNWQAGYKYTYTLLFGGVKGPDGNTTSSSDIGGGTYNDGEKVFTPTPITFTATVDSWTDANSQVAL